jgi:predicted RNA-binding Zn-ribbon protein involved in translation (DUF1610 family)
MGESRMLEDVTFEIGTVASGKDIGYKSRGQNLYVWLACPECGKERWISFTDAKREQLPKCPSCGQKSKKPRFKYDWSDLNELYVNQKLSTTDIAKIKGTKCVANLVSHALISQGIPARSESESQQLKVKSGTKTIHHGEQCWNWTNGRKKHSAGYIQVYAPDHPWTTKTGWMREHRYVWETVHNRRLPKGWVVHHLNGIKDDNRPENLVAYSKQKHGDLWGVYEEKVRTLEAKIKVLEHAMEANQLMFKFGDN